MAANDPALRRVIAGRGGEGKARNNAIRAQRFAEHADYIRRLVDDAPPLTEVQRARLAALLLGSRRPDDRAVA